MSVLAKDLKFPHTPNNPSGGTAIQVGVKGTASDEVVIPPGVVVFYKNETTGRQLDKVPVGVHVGPAGSQYKVIGVSMTGIVDPEAAKTYKDSAGRYSVAVSGSVTLFAPIRIEFTRAAGSKYYMYEMPKVLDTLWVSSGQFAGETTKTSTNNDYFIPCFATRQLNGTFKKIGVVHWVNDNFKNDKIAEVRVHLDVF